VGKELDTAIEAVRGAGKILKQNFGQGTTARKKSAGELVTPVDIECEKKIVSILQRDFPDYNVWSEEMGAVENESDCRWVVDPLDGTHNFVFGIPVFGVSIALEKRGRVHCGAIFLPLLNELFTAERGKGAFLNGSRIRVSKRKMGDALVDLWPRFLESPSVMERFARISAGAFKVRLLASASSTLASIAAGRIDAALAFNSKQGDFAAGWLLVEEAGGKLTRVNGSKFSIRDSAYIASSGVFHKELVEIMGGEK
jgi:myo-inositol-1(or 4)-monophosphatase